MIFLSCATIAYMRATKIIATIGPKTCRYEQIEKLASLGVNIIRLNMSHGDHAWHGQVIRAVKTINEKSHYSLAILLDTKGPEIRSGDIKQERQVKAGERFTFTIRHLPEYPADTVEVSYDGFIDDVNVGDQILLDGGMMSFVVLEKTTTDIICECINGGLLTSRRHMNIRGKSSGGPSITDKDWTDIDFGIAQGVDFIALSFVKDVASIQQLKAYLAEKKASIDIIAKIESATVMNELPAIIEASDGVMVARGDLGAEIPLEEVPLVQEEIVAMGRRMNRPVIVATHLLESMIVNPTPTRAEVTDISEAVKEGTDAIMLSGETASGKYPFEAVQVMDRVAKRQEERKRLDKTVRVNQTTDVKEEIARGAAIMANNIEAGALLVFTRRGNMAALLSRCRPNSPIYAFTNMSTVRRRLNIYWGVCAYRIEFSKDPEKTIQRAIDYLHERHLLISGSRVVVVSDILAGKEFIETIQVRRIL